MIENAVLVARAAWHTVALVADAAVTCWPLTLAAVAAAIATRSRWAA